MNPRKPGQDPLAHPESKVRGAFSKNLPQYIFCYKGKNSKVEKPVRHHLNHHFCGILVKNAPLQSNHENSKQTQTETFYKITVFCKSVEVM